MTRKILITGSNGLLGQKLVKLLSENDSVDLVATARGENRNPGGNYSFRTLDITNSDEVTNTINEENPDVVINTAAMTNVDQCELNQEECYTQNVTAVENLIRACEPTNTFLLHVSTDFIFDGSEGPLKEDATPAPVNYYGETKLWAEEKIQSSSILRWAIARTVLVFGVAHDMSRSNIVLWVKKSLEDKKEINIVDDQYRTPTLAEDLATGCWLIAEKAAEGVFHISGEEILTPYEIAVQTAEVFGLNKALINRTDSTKFTQPAKRPPKTGFVIDKAKTELGYQPLSFKESLLVLKMQLEKAE
ncbi:MAG: SDR family oxidoreductase [Candidatus Cyclobacteriaceae bacterium M2_1C_046]